PLHKLEHVNDGRHGNARSWISAERGKGWVMLELPRAAEIERIVWGRDREGKYRDRLAREYRFEVSTDGKAFETVASSADRLPPGDSEAGRLLARIAGLGSSNVYAGSFRTPDVVRLLKRGDVTQPQEEVGPGAIATLSPKLTPGKGGESERRLALADWIA